MALSREFKERVFARAENDPEFREGLIVEALNMILDGEITAGLMMLRDYINATGGMDEICKKLGKQKPAITRMLGSSGNPTLESIDLKGSPIKGLLLTHYYSSNLINSFRSCH